MELVARTTNWLLSWGWSWWPDRPTDCLAGDGAGGPSDQLTGWRGWRWWPVGATDRSVGNAAQLSLRSSRMGCRSCIRWCSCRVPCRSRCHSRPSTVCAWSSGPWSRLWPTPADRGTTATLQAWSKTQTELAHISQHILFIIVYQIVIAMGCEHKQQLHY